LATFSTWAALKTQLLDDLVSRNFAVEEYTTPGGTKVRARTLTEIKNFIEYCDIMIASEAGDDSITTYAQFDKPGAGI
jgi:hypothetical protein